MQGDERDVMIFSIGYGPDENRKITMNFGPLNKQGGWRRLNVAITRARYRNEIVSSIRAGDIPESVTTEGLRHLRRYLDYAARGIPALALDTSGRGRRRIPLRGISHQRHPVLGIRAHPAGRHRRISHRHRRPAPRSARRLCSWRRM